MYNIFYIPGQKSASSSSVNFSCSNPQVSNTNNMAPSSNTPQKCLNPIGLDSAGAPAVVNNNNIPGDTQESAASPSSWCGASGTAGVGCARATGAPALVLNDAASVDVGVGVDGEESSQGGSCGGASVERRPQQHQNNCSPPAFTVKSLVVGEVFASADYTGKINVYFAWLPPLHSLHPQSFHSGELQIVEYSKQRRKQPFTWSHVTTIALNEPIKLQ